MSRVDTFDVFPTRAKCSYTQGMNRVRFSDDAAPGWYWRADGDPIGPFPTEAEAIADAQGEGSDA
jgi:hypothetical protein